VLLAIFTVSFNGVNFPILKGL